MNQDTPQFSSFNLSQPLMKALDDLQFIIPSPIQAQTIPYLLDGKDAIALAQTGTGKTAAFALPILNRLNVNDRTTQALIVAPTRELAIQVAEQFEALSRHQKGVTVAVLCGGQEYRRQLKQLKDGAQVVVGTPGRILDHIDRRSLQLGNLSTFVLDEADEMLRMGFIEDVEAILAKLPPSKQMALFSATMPHRIRTIANQYLQDPVSIEIKAETATVKSIEQRFLFASQQQKPDALVRILAVEECQGVIVFVRTKSAAEEVADLLQRQSHRATAIHGDITQALRERIITQFKQGGIDVLVATDVAARGLDVDRVTHVINYDLPHDNETYVHRIGRTGRAGRSGVAVLFVTPKESRMISVIERHTRQRISKVSIPDEHMINQARKKQFFENIRLRLEHDNKHAYKRLLEEYVNENNADPMDVAAALALLLNQDKPWKKELPKLKASRSERDYNDRSGLDFKSSRGKGDKKSFKEERLRFGKGSKDNRRSFDEGRGHRDNDFSVSQDLFRIDVGRVHGVKPGNIVGAIANEAGLQSKFIKGLKIHEDHSTVFLPKGMPKKVMQDLMKAWVCGRQLNLKLVSDAS